MCPCERVRANQRRTHVLGLPCLSFGLLAMMLLSALHVMASVWVTRISSKVLERLVAMPAVRVPVAVALAAAETAAEDVR